MNTLIKRYKDSYGIELRILPIPWALECIVNMLYPDGVVYSAILKESDIPKYTQENICMWMKSKGNYVEE